MAGPQFNLPGRLVIRAYAPWRRVLVMGGLALLCGAEAATVVNNNAAALVLIVRHFCRSTAPEVVMSRGELVQIGSDGTILNRQQMADLPDDFGAFVFQRVDGVDVFHAPKVGASSANFLWRLRHNTATSIGVGPPAPEEKNALDEQNSSSPCKGGDGRGSGLAG